MGQVDPEGLRVQRFDFPGHSRGLALVFSRSRLPGGQREQLTGLRHDPAQVGDISPRRSSGSAVSAARS